MQSDRIEAPLARENETALAIVSAVTDTNSSPRTGEFPRKTGPRITGATMHVYP